MTSLEIVAIPKNLYYHEVAYVRGLEAENKRLRHSLQTIADAAEFISAGDLRSAAKATLTAAKGAAT